MTASNRLNCLPADMTVRELAQFRLLNNRLTKAERWIRECAARCANTSADVVMHAHVYCHFRTREPVFESSCEDVLATLDGGELTHSPDKDCDTCANERANMATPPLSDMLACAFFMELHRHLNRDWNAVLDVDRVHADFSIVFRRDFDGRS